MQLEIKSKNQEPLLNRTTVLAEAVFDKQTPSNAEVKKEIGKKLSTDESLIVIKKINGFFGEKKAIIEAYLYNDKASLDKIEPRKKEGKDKKPAEAKPEESKPAEKKEAPKPDQKKETPKEVPKEQKEAPKKEEPKK